MLDSARVRDIVEKTRPIPIVQTLRFELAGFEEGFCRLRVPYDQRYDGIFRSLHGGLLMTIADSAACFAIMTQTGPDVPLTTTDMNIRFLAPCLTDVTAEARVIKLGRTLCPVAVDLFDAQGTKVAVAQVTYIRLERRPSHAPKE
ncbi:MAG: PaaI family thioesterase [Phycisphaerae bacterium]|nr:PaaI family thioesterase [Phycisphaerae bacterium]